jgi:hypothetical protein
MSKERTRMIHVYFFSIFCSKKGNHARNQHAEQDNTELLDLDNAGRKAGGAGLPTCKSFTLIDILIHALARYNPTVRYDVFVHKCSHSLFKSVGCLQNSAWTRVGSLVARPMLGVTPAKFYLKLL